MDTQKLLGEFASQLLSGAIEVVDLSAVLGPDTPLIKLPPELAVDTPKVEIHAISAYDKNGPWWAWNWLKLGEHSGTHFDAPIHWISGKDYADGSTDTIPVQKFVGPVNVLDFSKEAAADPDFLLTVDHIKAWEAKHGAINPGEWVVMRTDWYKKNGSEKEFLNANETGPHTPGPTAEAILYLIEKDVVGWGSRDDRHRCRQGGRHGAAVPGPHADAQGQQIRPRQPLPARQAAAQGRGHHRRAAEDREGHRQPDARAGAGAEEVGAVATVKEATLST